MAEQPLSFFVVVSRPDFTHLIRLPRAFTRKYMSVFPKNVKIRTESGRSWDVKVESMENGRFCFSKGWSNFAQEVGLNLGEVLVFVLDDDGFTVNVSVFGSNGCEREFQFPITISDDDDEDEADDDEEYETGGEVSAVMGKSISCDQGKVSLFFDQVMLPLDITRPDLTSNASVNLGTARTKLWNDGGGKSWGSNPLYYEITLKRYHQSRVTLKSTFSNAAGFNFMEKRRVRVVGKHATNLVELDYKVGKRVDMAKGWPDFRVANALAYDKTYSFEFKPSKNAIYVNEVKTRN